MASTGANSIKFDDHIRQFSITDYGVSFLADRWKRSEVLTPDHPNGLITLGVFFMNASADDQEAFRRAADQWLDTDIGRVIRFDFSASQSQSQLRVMFDPSGGNKSSIGRNALDVPRQQKTMNIAVVADHVLMHELGHALGLQHEHYHTDADIVWNEDVVIAEMALPPNLWSPEMTRAQIFARYSQAANCVSQPKFDRKSIMLYPIPSHWTKNGFSSVQNMSISDGDRQCVAGLYAL